MSCRAGCPGMDLHCSPEQKSLFSKPVGCCKPLVHYVLYSIYMDILYMYVYIHSHIKWACCYIPLTQTLKHDHEGPCVSRSSGTTPEYAMHCESVAMRCLSQVASGCAVAEMIRWLTCPPATSIKQQVAESRGEPKFIIHISAGWEATFLQICSIYDFDGLSNVTQLIDVDVPFASTS